jgi:hypothetical protein
MHLSRAAFRDYPNHNLGHSPIAAAATPELPCGLHNPASALEVVCSPTHQPLRAMLQGAERRQDRFRPDPCSACGHDQVRVMLRTDYVLYLRCDRCLTMRTVPKPGVERFGT